MSSTSYVAGWFVVALSVADSTPRTIISHQADGEGYNGNEIIRVPADVTGIWEGVTPMGTVYVLDVRDVTRPYLSEMSFDADANPHPLTYVLGPVTIDGHKKMTIPGVFLKDGKRQLETVSVVGSGTSTKAGGHLTVTISVFSRSRHWDTSVELFRPGYLGRIAAVGAESRKTLEALRKQVGRMEEVRRAIPSGPDAGEPSGGGRP